MLCLAVPLVGCGPDPDGPTRLPPVESSSPSPVALPLPSEAAAETPQGAAAFAEYYFEVVNAGLQSGDASAVQRLSDPGCGGCVNLIGAIEEDPQPGERIEGGLFELAFAEAAPAEEGVIAVDLRYSVSALRVLDDDGRVLREKPASTSLDAQLFLKRAQEGWIVRGFENVEG